MVKKVVVIVIAVLLLLGGGVAAIGGGVLMALFGTDSTLTSGVHRVSTPTSALVTALDDIKDTNGFGTTVDKPTLRVSIPSADHPVFVGIGRAADVDRYLAGAAVDKVTDLEVDPFPAQDRAPGRNVSSGSAGRTDILGRAGQRGQRVVDLEDQRRQLSPGRHER